MHAFPTPLFAEAARSADPDVRISYPEDADEELFVLCDQLITLQDMWQRLWRATSADSSNTPADQIFDEFSAQVWPGTHLADDPRRPPDRLDVPVKLLDLSAVTPDGLQAKAAAILAICEASAYTQDSRPDETDMLLSVARDAAQSAYRPMGEAATPG